MNFSQYSKSAKPMLQARQLLNEFDIQSVEELNIELIAGYYNIPIRYETTSGFDGMLMRDDSNAIITINKNIREEGKKRSVIAHELGHYFLHPKTKQMDLIKENAVERWDYKNNSEENEANAFAAELLMPTSLFKPDVEKANPSFDLITKLAQKYNTSLISTAIKFITVTEEACALIASHEMKRKWFVAGDNFDFCLLNEEKISGQTCVSNIYKGKMNSERDKKVSANSWLSGYDQYSKAFITEDSISLGKNYGVILTLLWIEEDI